MRLDYREGLYLPSMAWCARVQLGNPVVLVRHGSGVECDDSFFVEGVWNGAFRDGGFPDATICLGSGGRITREGAIQFAGTSHPKERLHVLGDEREVVVSNSLPFLLAETEEHLDPTYRFYEHDLISFVDGLDELTTRIPTASGRSVQLLYCANLLVSSDLQLRPTLKAEPRRFLDYADYITFLREEVAKLYANADDQARQIRFRPLATISSGYDSPAAAILARGIGCTDAVTFTSARENFQQDSDSGTEIGRLLGMHVEEFDRVDYRRLASLPSAEFLAVGTGGEDVVMAAFEERLRGTLFFTGFMGDSLWARIHHDPRGSERFKVAPGGASLAEFRLRVGFVHLPVPLLSLTRHPDLHRISNSREMGPWRSPNPLYDRPVPRRFIEEHGIPRHMFGQSKQAVTQPFYFNERLADIMSPAGYTHFQSYLARTLPPGHAQAPYLSLRERMLYSVLPGIHRLNYLASRAVTKVAGRFGRAVGPVLLVPKRFRKRLTENTYTVHWGVATLRERYSGQHPQPAPEVINPPVAPTPVAQPAFTERP